MTCPLKLLFEAINQAHSEHDMEAQIVPKIDEYFAAKRRGFFLQPTSREQIAIFRKYLFTGVPWNEGLGSLFAVNHPRNAKLIDNHAKAGSPEGFLERHLHCSVFCQCMK